MTVQEFQADKIEGAAKLLAFWLGAMPEDKQSWVPEVAGAAGLRTAREQVAECAAANRFFTALLKGEKPALFRPFEVKSEYTTLEEAQQDLIVNGPGGRGERVQIGKRRKRRRGGYTSGQTWFEGLIPQLRRQYRMTGYQVIEFPYRNMTYHGGQLNQLQLLYGDAEFHIPKG